MRSILSIPLMLTSLPPFLFSNKKGGPPGRGKQKDNPTITYLFPGFNTMALQFFRNADMIEKTRRDGYG